MEETTIAPHPVAVEITRTFAAPRDKVFRAWTEAGELQRWFAPAPDYTTVVPALDLRAGGRYVIEMHHKDGNMHSVSGEYRDVSPPGKVSFTWGWDGQSPRVESLVTIHFRDLGKITELRLTHELLATAEQRERHVQGWNGCFAQLDGYL